MGHEPKDQSEGQKQDDQKPDQLRHSPWGCRDRALSGSVFCVGWGASRTELLS